jgi:hypothetical protein
MKTEADILDDEWTDPDLGRTIFGDYARSWIDERPGLRPKTIQLYQYLLRRHLEPTFGTKLIAAIREPHVRRWRKQLLVFRERVILTSGYGSRTMVDGIDCECGGSAARS